MRKEKATVLSKEEKLKIEEMLRNAIEKHFVRDNDERVEFQEIYHKGLP